MCEDGNWTLRQCRWSTGVAPACGSSEARGGYHGLRASCGGSLHAGEWAGAPVEAPALAAAGQRREGCGYAGAMDNPQTACPQHLGQPEDGLPTYPQPRRRVIFVLLKKRKRKQRTM